VTSSLSDSDLNAAANAAKGKDVALVFISADSGEGYITTEGNAGDRFVYFLSTFCDSCLTISHRNDLKAWHNGDALVAAVAAVNKNTVVVVHSVGQIIMESWIDHANGKPAASVIRSIMTHVMVSYCRTLGWVTGPGGRQCRCRCSLGRR
jgi:beta-glucosidase